MRAPQRRRPRLRVISPAPPEIDISIAIDTAVYVGSTEHKDTPSFAGEPRPRSDASICDRRFAWQQALITKWLRTALRNGTYGAPWEGNYPRYAWVWHPKDNIVYEGRLVNRETGEYKGYPLERDEWPAIYEDSNGVED